MDFKPLSREELKSVIEGKSIAKRVPSVVHFWTNQEVFGDNKDKAISLLNKYPNDVLSISINTPDTFYAPDDDPSYRWSNYDDPYVGQDVAIDSQIVINDWEQLDGILADFPNPNYKGMFKEAVEDDGRYRLGFWWHCLFERFWKLRGMTNSLMDFYTDPEEIHRLMRSITDFYKIMIKRAKNELNLDGIFTSDDIGTQTGPFFSPEIFREFFKPYYKELIDTAHSVGIHFWLHTCGNIEIFIPDFIEIGLDVLHPIQKYTMEEKRIAEKYGNDICIWAGFDVQRIIPWGTPEEVRNEVRFMMDTYFRPEGKFMITAGNAITSDCKPESLEALLDEAYHYGIKKVSEVKIF